jgi:hypothetical protein
MIVDDSPVTRAFIARVVDLSGLNVVEVSTDGRGAYSA